jgi:hypothetical protein
VCIPNTNACPGPPEPNNVEVKETVAAPRQSEPNAGGIDKTKYRKKVITEETPRYQGVKARAPGRGSVKDPNPPLSAPSRTYVQQLQL